MKIPFRALDMRLRRRVVGCGVQGRACLALDVSQGREGKWTVHGSLAGDRGDAAFAARLAKMAGARPFWVSPSEEGGLQVETTRAIEIPPGDLAKKGALEGFFRTQIKSAFVNETIVFGGMRMKGEEVRDGAAARCVHNVGGGAIRDNVMRDYRAWYALSVRRPHVASTALALANAYLALYPAEKRRAKPLRLVLLKGRSVYRGILMDDWKYVDEVLLPRMEGDDASRGVIEGRMAGWIKDFGAQHAALVGTRAIEPLVVAVKETPVSGYEHWDLWGEGAAERIDMTDAVAEAILANRDIAPVAFGMALQGGC